MAKYIALTLLMIFTAACAAAPDDGAAPPDPAFALSYGDFLIYMGQDIEEVLEGLGEPLGIFEAPSCAFDGNDRIFRYPGMQIHTYPLDGNDFVHTIIIRDDSIAIHDGIRIGSDFDAVLAAYGDDYERDFDMYTYESGAATLAFLVEDGYVSAITYGLIME